MFTSAYPAQTAGPAALRRFAKHAVGRSLQVAIPWSYP